jgi:hypothetical protein
MSMSNDAPHWKKELNAFEFVVGAKASAECLEELLDEGMKKVVAAEQLARVEWLTRDRTGSLAQTYGDYLGGSWDTPFGVIDEKRRAVVDEINRLDSFALRKAADAASALVVELQVLAEDLEGHVAEAAEPGGARVTDA